MWMWVAKFTGLSFHCLYHWEFFIDCSIHCIGTLLHIYWVFDFLIVQGNRSRATQELKVYCCSTLFLKKKALKNFPVYHMYCSISQFCIEIDLVTTCYTIPLHATIHYSTNKEAIPQNLIHITQPTTTIATSEKSVYAPGIGNFQSNCHSYQLGWWDSMQGITFAWSCTPECPTVTLMR